MADPLSPPPSLSLPHRVVIDALGFYTSQRLADDWHRIALDALRDALPQARPTGLAPVDGLLKAGTALVAADQALARAPAFAVENARLDLTMAELNAAGALAEFFRARLAQSVTGLFHTPTPDASSTPQVASDGGALAAGAAVAAAGTPAASLS